MDGFRNNEEIYLKEFKTSVSEVMYSIAEVVLPDQIQEVRIFGSYLKQKTKIIKGIGWWIFKKEEETVIIRPNDLDVLVITKSTEGIVRLRPKISGRVLEFSQCFGYGYSFWANGIKFGLLHLIVVSQDHYSKALSQGDEIAIEIEKNNRLIHKRGIL